jgi:O-antigen/teichoic acid export membrane protein
MTKLRAFIQGLLQARLSAYFTWQVLQLLVSLLSNIVLVRLLGATKLGELSYVMAYTAIFGVIAGIWLKDIVIKELVLYPENTLQILGSAWVISVGCSIMAYGICLGCYVVFGHFNTEQWHYIGIYGCMFFYTPLHVVYFYFDARKIPQKIAQINTLTTVFINTIKLLAAYYSSTDLYSFLVLNGLASASLPIAYFFLAHQQGISMIRWRFSVSIAKSLIRQSLPVFCAKILGILYLKVDQLILAQYTSFSDLGKYNAAVKLIEVWYFVPMLLFTSYYPSIIEAKKKNAVAFDTSMILLFKICFWCFYGVALIIAILSPFIGEILYGSTFGDIGYLLLGLSVCLLFVCLDTARNAFIYLHNLSYYMILINGISTLLNIGLNFLFVPQWGVSGAVLASVFSYTFSGLLSNSCFRPMRPIMVLIRQAWRQSLLFTRF